MAKTRSLAGAVLWGGALLLVSSATGVSLSGVSWFPAAAAAAESGRSEESRAARLAAYERLTGRLDVFEVSGGVRTDEGLLLPETIIIEIRSEICVESRDPGARFWSLDYDTCYVFVDRDTVDARGEYSVSVPSLDADVAVESRHDFGDLRLVPRGPVSFLADSDAGWRHQETFTSSRTQTRDLVLTLEPETFWVVKDGAQFRARPDESAESHADCPFGTAAPVVRFHQGWAQVILADRIGWIEMKYLGTEAQMLAGKPFKGKPEVSPVTPGEDAEGDG